jgi:hypothetical protein
MTGNELKRLVQTVYPSGDRSQHLADYLGISPRHARNLMAAELLPKRYEKAVLGLKILVDTPANIS